MTPPCVLCGARPTAYVLGVQAWLCCRCRPGHELIPPSEAMESYALRLGAALTVLPPETMEEL